jgi:hypothetical protein
MIEYECYQCIYCDGEYDTQEEADNCCKELKEG